MYLRSGGVEPKALGNTLQDRNSTLEIAACQGGASPPSNPNTKTREPGGPQRGVFFFLLVLFGSITIITIMMMIIIVTSIASIITVLLIYHYWNLWDSLRPR